jgi:hypothetical protein
LIVDRPRGRRTPGKAAGFPRAAAKILDLGAKSGRSGPFKW